MNIFRRLGCWLFRKSSRTLLANRVRLTLETLEDRITPSTNAIVAENLLPGNPQSEWDVVGDGDPTLQGFATDISVNHGQTVSFKINDTASAPYHIDIYRMGYYGGAGARKVATIASSLTTRTVQPDPLKDPTTNLVDAGNWSVSASWAVPAAATSGIYFARLVREDTGGASHILFVVRDDSGHSDLLFQTSDTTWEAYNHWGGESVYQGVDGDFDDRAVKVSYNRPLTLRGTPGGFGSDNSPFHAEYPMVRWLEANGYDVSYFTDVDSDRYGSEILEHRVFLSVGHDEYWSGQQRTNVEAARDAGINLAFFSGNEIFWKTRWETSIDGSGTPYRTLVTYKESKDNARTDPLDLSQGIWTGTWRDARFSPPADGGRPENALSGTLYMNDRTSTEIGISMQVGAADGQLRFWRNTAVASLAPGQVATIGDRVVGYETDEDLDNGFRPAGLMDLSATTFTTTTHVLVPWGTVVGAGTSTHQMTLYRAASGALVFGAGTVQWSWGLDGNHDDGVSTPDASIRQATVNLFADMGVQPANLQPGLVAGTMSTDLTRPTSAITSPSAGFSLQAGVSVTITGTASDSGGGAVGGVEVSVDGGQTWHKATGRGNWSYTWTPDTSGPVTILSRAADDSGNIEIPSAGVQVNVFYGATSTTGLVAAYNFNSGSGSTVTDSSASHNDGTITNAAWSTAGMFGSGALSFSGTSTNPTWVTVADSNSLDLTNAMTLEAWVRPTSANGFGTVLFKERSGGDTYSLYAVNGTSKPPAAYVNTGGEKSAEGPALLPVNAWSHLAATYNGSTLSLYVNGNLVSTQAASGPITTSTGVLRIGGNAVYGDYFQGLIDEVRIYNRVLNLGEIRSDVSTPIGGSLDTAPPAVALATPSGTVSGVTTLSATAGDNVAVAGVQFMVNGQPVGPEVTSGTSNYAFQWNTATVANGSYTINARARDVAGNAMLSPPVTLTVNNSTETTPPAVSLTNLTPGATVGGSVVLSAVASDNIGVVGVQFKANGVNIGAEVTAAPYRVLWSTAGLTSGSYAITAVARDAAGNVTTSQPITMTVDATPPTVTAQSPSNGATNVPTNANITATFSESIQPGSLSFVLVDASGNPLAGTATYDDTTHTATFTHNVALSPSATYTMTVSGAKDLAGNVMTGSVSWSFTAASQITDASIWADTVTPSVLSANDSSAVEVGVKFRSSVDGSITGLQFYKGAGNTGVHVGHLWAADGTLLATATFANETATGWQQVSFSSPVAISANTTYIASYFAPVGHYAANSGYFASVGVNAYPLRALANGEDGGNGVYRYTPNGAFPNQSFSSTNYWVDVLFTTQVQDTAPPTVVSQTPPPNSSAIPTAIPVTATFSEPVQASTISFVLTDSAGNVVTATVSYNSTTWTATLTPNAALADSTTFTATVSGAQDMAGNPMASASTWSFTTAVPQGDTGSLTIWTDSVTPATAAANDSSAVEVGVKFRSDQAGSITGLRFYKGAGNTGVHVGHLWAADGTLLATATFANETATGWQQVSFSSPVAISANTTYIASYFAPVGHYAANSGYFASAGTDNGFLHALSNAAAGGNGVFKYGSSGGFPTQTYNSTNYWVDVVYSSTANDTAPPTVASETPAPGATGVPVTSTVTATFSEPVQASTISFVLTDSAGNVVTATVNYNDTTHTATLTPGSSLALNTTYTATVSGAKDLAGNKMDPFSWSFTTPTPATNATLWPSTTTPAVASYNDSSAIEVGVKFFSGVSGYITGLRFYKGAGNTGTHVGHLWAADGTLLATATFTDETATGWQQVSFSSPVAIDANTLYIASYYAPSGHYSANNGYFATTGMDSGPLHAPADGVNGGNGLYVYGSGGGFPGNTYSSTNYWVDVVFSQTTTDSTPPTVTAVSPADGAHGALPSSTITASLSEDVLANTISFVVKDSFNVTVTGNLNYDTVNRIAIFIPTAPLLSFMTYTVSVSGVKDLSGNTMAAPYTWSFTTRGIWTQTSVADFSTGTKDGTSVTNNAGGEVQLAPLLQDEFSGSSLDSSKWATTSWASSGGGPLSVTTSGGVLSLGGGAIMSLQAYINTAVEGSISFGAVANQHFGLATGLTTLAGNYWAIFSTKTTTNHLYARVNNNGAATDVDLGALPSGFHTYKVQPISTGFQFYVDGVLKTTINASFQATQALKAALSAFSGAPKPPLQADWVRFDRYGTSTSGTFTSVVFDAGQSVTWDNVNWTASVPAGTSITVQVRVGNTATPDGTWSDWASVVNNSQMLASNGNLRQGEYLQYRVILTTSDSTLTPTFYDISFTYR